jgi:oleate hydratase
MEKITKKFDKVLNASPFSGEGVLKLILKNTYFEHILPVGEEDEDHHDSFFNEQLEKLKEWAKGFRH